MKVAVFHELPVGGARRAVNEIAVHLKKKHIVDLYFVDEQNNKHDKKYFSRVYLYKFKQKKWLGNDSATRVYKDTLELLKLYLLHKRIAKEIDNKHYDFVFVNASKFIEAPFILRFLKTKKVFYCHDPYYRLVYESQFTFPKNLSFFKKLYEKMNRLIRKTLDKQNFFKADFILANSNFTKKKVEEIYKKESKVAYLGTDTVFFKPNSKIVKDIDILYIGSREPLDAYFLLERSLSYMKTRPKVKKIFIEDGWISDDSRLLNLYQRSKIVVGFAYNEPLGLVPLEAMAAGAVVVAVEEGGYRETILDGKTGFLVERNPETIAQKIDYLLKNSKLLYKMGTNARQHVLLNWTWEKSVEDLEKIFKELL